MPAWHTVIGQRHFAAMVARISAFGPELSLDGATLECGGSIPLWPVAFSSFPIGVTSEKERKAIRKATSSRRTPEPGRKTR